MKVFSFNVKVPYAVALFWDVYCQTAPWLLLGYGASKLLRLLGWA